MDAFTSSPIRTGVSILFYTSIFCFILFLVILAINAYVTPILPFVSGTTTVAAKSTDNSAVNNQLLYSTRVCPPDTPMNFNTISQFNYNKFSVSFDCFVQNTYLSTDVPRVVLYFGSTSDNPATVNDNTDLVEYRGTDDPFPRILTVSQTDILSKFSNSSFIIYIDPVKNDLKVGLITMNSGNLNLELLPIIENIPINQPFTITCIISQNFVEVYKDYQLKYTYTPKYTLNTPTGNPHMFGPLGFLQGTVKIANVMYFDNIITTTQLRNLVPITKSASFFQ